MNVSVLHALFADRTSYEIVEERIGAPQMTDVRPRAPAFAFAVGNR
jgi:hypothetical protein